MTDTVKPTAAPTHPDYDETASELETIRICMDGSLAVKKSGYRLLPHPSQIDQSSKEQVMRYLEYKANAEYQNDGQATKRQMLGKMRIDDTEIEFPDALDYLVQNVDGDGLGLKDAIKYSIGEVQEMKWHFLVADFKGLSGVDLTQISLAEQMMLDPKAHVKQYSRDSLTNWAFRKINGTMQLSYLQFRELGTEFNPDTGLHTDVESYLILALDEDGNYYQQKKVYGSSGAGVGEKSYVTVSGMPLKWLPVAVVADEPMPSGALPKAMGFLHSIIDVSLQRYRMSARYKETQIANTPTKITKGWLQGDKELFSEINGRDSIMVGGYGINNMPNNVEMDVISASADMGDFHWDFERYDKLVAKLGGTNETGNAGALTATEAAIIAGNQNALLESLATSAENAWRRVVSYCGMFMGLWKPDAVESALEQITIDLPRDFAKSKLTVDEVRVLLEMRMQSTISEAELHRQIKNGGWLIADVDAMLAELDQQAPRMDLPEFTTPTS